MTSDWLSVSAIIGECSLSNKTVRFQINFKGCMRFERSCLYFNDNMSGHFQLVAVRYHSNKVNLHGKIEVKSQADKRNFENK